MEFVLSPKSINDILKERVHSTPENNALTYGTGSWNYRELETVSGEMAGRLLAAGIRSGAKVALMADTAPEGVALLYGLLRLGAVAVMVSPYLESSGLSYALSVSDANDLIVSAKEIRPVAPEGVKVWSADGSYGNKLPDFDAAGEEALQAEFANSDVRVSGMVIFTSGTTSHPKAVFLDQYRLINNARCHREFFHVNGNDRFVAALPMEHILCVIITVLLPLVSGGCMCITKDKHTASILDTVERENCTFLCGVPTMYHAIIERPDFDSRNVESLKYGMTGGAACSPALFAEIEKKLGILLVSTLGQTETAGGFTMYREDETEEERYNSVGVPSYGMEVKVMNGEICVRGYLVSGGYLKKPEATAALIDAEGWLHTGDLGRFDEKGLLYVTGRKKDIIIRGGENISAAAIERVIEKCPGISEVKCFGVPDEHHGEEVCVCVLPKEGQAVSEEQIRIFASEKLESWKVPRYIVVMKEFPRTDVGKIATAKLKETVLSQLKFR